MLNFSTIEKMTNDELLQEHQLYKEQLRQSTASGKSSFCLQSLAQIEVELDNRNIEHTKFAFWDFEDTFYPKEQEKSMEQARGAIVVLQSYDEVAIQEAIIKNHCLDLKNLNKIDIEKTVIFVMEQLKGKGCAPDASMQNILFAGYHDFLARKYRASGMSYFLSGSSTLPKLEHQKSKKQPNYRKFEKKKWF